MGISLESNTTRRLGIERGGCRFSEARGRFCRTHVHKCARTAGWVSLNKRHQSPTEFLAMTQRNFLALILGGLVENGNAVVSKNAWHDLTSSEMGVRIITCIRNAIGILSYMHENTCTKSVGFVQDRCLYFLIDVPLWIGRHLGTLQPARRVRFLE